MKIVIAPDSFKECLTAPEAAAAIAQGLLEVVPQVQVDLCPMADGGEGTVDAIVAATGGQTLAADVFDPLGGPIRARFGLLGKGASASLPGEVGLVGAMVASEGDPAAPDVAGAHVAVVEMAAASGIALVPPALRDPLRTTTFGSGQLIMAAMDAGAGRIIVGVGGSATVDGGCGCAQGLGVTFLDGAGRPIVCGLAGGGLKDIQDIDLSGCDGRIADVTIEVACDVTNPLTGSNGAAMVFAPQKGATIEVAEQLEEGLSHLVEVVRRMIGVDLAHMAGAGAAGGLAGGLVAFAGAKLRRGVDLVAGAVELRRRLAGADLCITGEGHLDAISMSGKTVVGVADIAADLGVPVVCIPGQADPDVPRDPFEMVRPLANDTVSVEEALENCPALLRQRAAEVLRAFLQT